MNMGAQVELPRYRSHKIVRAAKVTAMQQDDPEGMPEGWEPTTTLFLGEIAAAVTVKDSWIQRSGCEVGGYYVRYEDGFTSWSQAKAFEDGYTKLEEPPPGWKPIDDMMPTKYLCHSDGRWWESPEGAWFCGTCHPAPWIGFGYRHANDRIET